MNPSENRTPAIGLRQRPDSWLDWLLTLPVLWMGTALAFLSIANGIRNSIQHSLDFQWSPARLLAHHVDPWATYLSGDPGHRILLNQVPNDLHELYVAMLPFGYLPLMPAKIIWAAINVALVLLSCCLVARMYELDGRKTWLFTLLVLTSTSARVTIGNGQVTALVLASLALWASHKVRAHVDYFLELHGPSTACRPCWPRFCCCGVAGDCCSIRCFRLLQAFCSSIDGCAHPSGRCWSNPS